MISLKPFQLTGIDFLTEKRRAGLFDEPGLGKTVQALKALENLKALPGLVICPASLRDNWRQEVLKWAPNLLKSLTVVSYHYVRRHWNELKSFKGLVFDESHRLRNKNATTMACLALSWQTDIKFLLTGTPIINNETDLYYQCLILNRENEFGGLAGLKSACLNPLYLQEICKKFTLRREKKDVLVNFPNKYDKSVIISPDLRKYYAFEDSLRAEIAALFRQKLYSEAYRLIFTRIGALKQAIGIAKVPEIVQFVANIEKTGDKSLIFGCYNVTLSTIANFCGYPLINSCTPRNKRREIVHNFEKKGNGLVLSGAVGGEGLTLTRANHVVFAELFWYPALHEQAEDRAHRISQRKTVYSHYLVTKSTIEEKIWSILMRKHRKTKAFCKSIKAEIVRSFIEESDVIFD